MSNLDGRWEQGSDFHLSEYSEDEGPDLPMGAHLYGSGRDALRALIAFGVNRHGWKVLWVPSYFCQTVLQGIRIEGIELRGYHDSPLDSSLDPIELESSDCGAILILNPFGLRASNRPVVRSSPGIWVVDDHTHDPWSASARNSSADYCVASLRKTIPIPDGGIVWSPRCLPLPHCPPASRDRTNASLAKLGGMVLKELYLKGASDDKDRARRFLVQGENGFGDFEISGMPSHTKGLLSTFPARSWRTKRLQNFRHLSTLLSSINGIRTLVPESEFAVPFSVVIRTETAQSRNYLREQLLQSRIYPAVLWSLEHPEVSNVRTEDIDLGRTSLSIHCDGRYDSEDMNKVAETIRIAMSASVTVI